jgi:transketolase
LRDTFIRNLTNLANNDPNIFLIVGDLGYGVIEDFARNFPDRYLNAGISEQNMIGMASGLAASGYKVFVYSIANFPTMRCLEQIRNDVAYHDLNVTIVSVGAGFAYGTLGYSHFAVEDIAVMRVLPNLEIYSPGDTAELELMLPIMISKKGPKYLRLGKNGEPLLSNHKLHTLDTPRMLNEGSTIALLSTGGIGSEAVEALKKIGSELREKISHFSVPVLDYALIDSMRLNEYKLVITIEEHVLDGGFGSFILEYLETKGEKVAVKRMGISKDFSYAVGNQEYLRGLAKIDSNAIIMQIELSLLSL